MVAYQFGQIIYVYQQQLGTRNKLIKIQHQFLLCQRSCCSSILSASNLSLASLLETTPLISVIFSALAFCNNSEPQKKRRQILQKFTFPHSHSNLGNYLDTLCLDECQHLIGHLQNGLRGQSVQMDLKPLIAKACANIFNRYFCSSPRCDYR